MGKTAQLVVKGKIQVYTPTNEETVVVDWSCEVPPSPGSTRGQEKEGETGGD